MAYLNLKLALDDFFSLEKRKRIVKELFRNLAMNFTELLYFPRINQHYVNKYIKIIGEDKIKKVLTRGKGLILLTAHFGNWELSSLVAQIKGLPMVVLARQQKPERLNNLLNQYRSRFGARVIMRGVFLREALNSLRENKIMGILGDQKSGKKGILVDLFSRLAWTPAGVIELIRHTGAGVLPVFIIREKGPYHRIEIGDELFIDDKEVALRNFHIILENYVKKYPEQWLWFHRRWKGSPSKKIIILSDGKAGHLNQAKALANMVSRAILEKNAHLEADKKKKLVEIKEIEINFRNIFTRFLINILGFFARENCRGCLKCLKFCLKENSYKPLVSHYGDIIISCGASLSAVNLFLAKENQAKSFIIMKPGIYSLKRFDLAIIPSHDRPKKLPNILITQTALNLVNETTMEEGIKKLKEAGFNLRKDKINIGVLIGGETKEYTLTEELISKVIDELEKVCKDFGTELLVTTSRRTPKKIEGIIKNRFSTFSGCSLLIIASEYNIDKAVPGILGLADIVVVSGESISMISEALSSRKPVVVFAVEKKKPRITKQDRFLNNLKSQGYVNLVEADELHAVLERVLQKLDRKELVEFETDLYDKIKSLIASYI